MVLISICLRNFNLISPDCLPSPVKVVIGKNFHFFEFLLYILIFFILKKIISYFNYKIIKKVYFYLLLDLTLYSEY